MTWVQSDCHRLHFDVLRSHRLLIDIGQLGHALFFDDDGFHTDSLCVLNQ